MPGPPVLVVGAGIAGTACARRLTQAGVPVEVLERSSHPGGRMSSRGVDGRPVDLGASYVTAADPRFQAVVADWEQHGLVRRWTDTFAVGSPAGLRGSKAGPDRYSTPNGLGSLVADLARGLSVTYEAEVEDVDPGPCVDGRRASAVVLAMPDPQALDLLSDDLAEELAVVEDGEWSATVTLAAGWPDRTWPDVDGVFVDDSDVLTWIADDGRRRGDGAPVLVAHSTDDLAQDHLDDPQAALDPMLSELRRVLPGVGVVPQWSLVKRWALARPDAPRAAPFFLGDSLVGLCGDGWHAPSRVEAAFLSGTELGDALVERLG